MSGMVNYRARKSCIVGGVYRRPGEIFIGPEMDEPPAHLEALSEVEAAEAQVAAKAKKTAAKGKSKAPAAAVGAGAADIIGVGKAVNSAEVTSADLIKE